MNSPASTPGAPTDDARFEFGENWRRFLDTVDEDRVRQSTKSLAQLLQTESLSGRTFIDVGSGSGLSSLAALRLGASRVFSFDYDTSSVACTAELKRRFAPEAENWTVERGDALDPTYLQTAGTYDVVYSWGVLHHTGEMWRALDNVTQLVTSNGTLCVALYNDQGRASRVWKRIKRTYNALPAFARPIAVMSYAFYGELRSMVGRWRRGMTVNPVRHWAEYRSQRGMSVWHDYVDWIGGYPFEVASPAAVTKFFEARGFAVRHVIDVGSDLGCNEFVFVRRAK